MGQHPTSAILWRGPPWVMVQGRVAHAPICKKHIRWDNPIFYQPHRLFEKRTNHLEFPDYHWGLEIWARETVTMAFMVFPTAVLIASYCWALFSWMLQMCTFRIHNIKNQGNAFLSLCSLLMSSSCKPGLWRADSRLWGTTQGSYDAIALFPLPCALI